MSSKRPKNPPDRFSPPFKKPARRGRPRKNDEDDDDDEEEAPLQTQMPMTPPRPDPPAYATRRTPASQKGVSQRSTAKKAATPRPPSATKAAVPPSATKNVTVVAPISEPVPKGEVHPEEEKEEEEVITEFPEVKEEEQKVAVVRAKHADIVLNQYYYDIIDMEQHCVLFERSTRTERWNVLQHFWNTYPHMDKDYGRLFVRTRFCSLLVDGCSEPGYSDSSLVAWEPNDWHDFIDDLAQTKEACLLPECHHVFGLGPDHEQPNVELNAEERAQLMAFTKKYTVIEKACQVSLHLSPFRLSLEQQIAAGDTGPPKDVSPEFVQTLFVTAKNNDSFVIRRHLLRLFISDPVPEGKESANLEAINPQPILRNLEELKEILGAKPFSLLWFQSRLEQLVWMWNEACYGLQQPYLQLISYHEIDRRNPGTPRGRRSSRTPATPPRPPPPGNTEVLATLKRRREALRENHGADPLSESRRIAKVLKKNILHDGKKSKMMVAFEDSDEEEEVIAPARRLPNNNAEEKEDNEENAPPGERVRLPAMPEHAAGAANDAPVPVGTKIYTGPPPDEGIFDVTGNVVRRHPWTDEEIAALTLGYAKYGAGKWVHIKQEYGYILRNRTTVQIKDKFRNMQRRGELPDAV